MSVLVEYQVTSHITSCVMYIHVDFEYLGSLILLDFQCSNYTSDWLA